jgi:DNA mismatch repair ATPase MutS
VIGRAEQVLESLEESREPREISNVTPQKRWGAGYQISKEEHAVYDARVETWRSILQQLMAVDIANMTPLQALNLLNEMQVMVKESGGLAVQIHRRTLD